MKRIQIEKAAKTLKTDRIEDVEIAIHSSIDLDTHNDSMAVMHTDAQVLFDTLRQSLPGGTLHHLLVLFLQDKACGLIVRF